MALRVPVRRARATTRVLTGALLLSAAVGVQLRAQGAAIARPSATSADSARETGTVPARNVFRRRPALLVGALGVGATLAFRPLDGPVMQRVRRADLQSSASLQHVADAFNALGGRGFVIASAGLLAGGYGSRQATVTQLGIRTSQAMVLNAIVNSTLKGLVGRQRPFVDETRPNVFAAGRGFTTPGRTSFPSGHASSSFAFVTAASAVLRERRPRIARVATPLLFTSATLVGAARVYGAHHWPSDIAAGATVGALSGLLVTRREVEIGVASVRWRF